jgi:hypothetical protein
MPLAGFHKHKRRKKQGTFWMSDLQAFQNHLQRARNFLNYPWQDQRLIVKTYILLGLARLAIKTVKFERLVGYLGTSMVESPVEAPGPHLREARRIAWAVHTASQYTPWNSNCFPQAIAAKVLLRQRGIQSTLYLGAAFKAHAEMEAHAWLRCGRLYVTGGKGHLRFGVVGIFGEN